MADYLEPKKVANEVHKGIVIAVHNAKSGHPGGSLSSADISTYLYFEGTDVGPKEPQMLGRSRFILSKDHVVPGYHSTLAHHEFSPVEDLKTLRCTGPYLQGHPDKKHIPGVDISSDSPGQGTSAATGMALSARLQVEDYQVYTLCGDGELEEGQVWETAMFAGFRKLDNLIVVVDDNELQIDGVISEVCSPYPIDRKFEALQFHMISIDGRDFGQIEKAFKGARQTKGRPTAIIAKALKEKGASFMKDSVSWHGVTPSGEQYMAAMERLEKAGEALCRE